MPGMYDVNIWINNVDAGEFRLHFVACDLRLCPQFTLNVLKSLGIRLPRRDEIAKRDPDSLITDISHDIPESVVEFDFSRRRLNLSIPQAHLNRHARGYISPDKWEHGIPMLFTSYSASGSQTQRSGRGERASHQYVSLRSGANYDSWRLRNNSTLTHSNDDGHQWNATQTWLERDIYSLKSRLSVGEVSSPGMLFDSFGFRGISVGTQDEMLPDSMQGFAPEVRGIAMTNATVEIRQNGHLLYQTFVTPGPFVINDLFAMSTSGDLDITVHEENGDVRTFTQSFAVAPISARKNAFKYTVTAGEFGTKYYRQYHGEPQRFIQTELLYGILDYSSIYGGLISAQHYHSGMLGLGQGMGQWGAFSLDLSLANTAFADGSQQQGQSWRMRYSKRFDSTGTNMTLAGYRYAIEGYFNFEEASNHYHSKNGSDRRSLKQRLQLSLSQHLGAFGTLAVTANQSTYWRNTNNKSRTVTGSWSKSFNGINISLNQSQSTYFHTGRMDYVTSANVSFPLGKWLSPSSNSTLHVSNNMSYAQRGSTSLNSTLSGTALEGGRLTYTLSQSHSRQSDGSRDSTAISGTYQGANTTVSMGFASYYGEYAHAHWGLRGAVVAHPYGITLSQPLTEGSSYALINAPGTDGTKVKNRRGLMTDARGHAVVTSLMPYRENTVALDTATLSDNVDVIDPIQRTIPTREALVLSDFETRVGYRVFITLRHNQKPLPLGTIIEAGDIRGLTNEKGQLYLSGVPEQIRFHATLPDGKRCHVTFLADKAKTYNGIIMSELECI